jgi:hypothetical protein
MKVHTRRSTSSAPGDKATVSPLRKSDDDGNLYTRLAAIEAKLAELLDTPRDELAERCLIRSTSDPGYIPHECLVYLVRATKRDNNQRWFETLFRELSRRVLRKLPKPQQSERSTDSDLRERVHGHFQELIALDRQGYCDKLDFFEIRFDSALARLKVSVGRKLYRHSSRRTDLDDPETGELRADVEKAVGSYNPFRDDDFSDPHYRSQLDAAIAQLPPEQREIIEMLRLGIPMDSKDPNVVSIAATLNCVEKTVRNRRDRALINLRRLMGGDEA